MELQCLSTATPNESKHRAAGSPLSRLKLVIASALKYYPNHCARWKGRIAGLNIPFNTGNVVQESVQARYAYLYAYLTAKYKGQKREYSFPIVFERVLTSRTLCYTVRWSAQTPTLIQKHVSIVRESSDKKFHQKMILARFHVVHHIGEHWERR
jgi:hypothetical protein